LEVIIIFGMHVLVKVLAGAFNVVVCGCDGCSNGEVVISPPDQQDTYSSVSVQLTEQRSACRQVRHARLAMMLATFGPFRSVAAKSIGVVYRVADGVVTVGA